ncbi:MAG: 3-hydroxybutyryl-CoA dehydrogenase [Rhodospirillales bacterium]|nr:3-hydroxybutyryl-CoA dehydrogenase [Rhodospirillales bacterium]
MSTAPKIIALGAGRMGRGIAQVFAYAGHDVTILDFKERDAAVSEALLTAGKAEVKENLEFLASLEVLDAEKIPAILDRIHGANINEAADVLSEADYIFEGVPEVLELKEDAIKRASKLTPDSAVIASTTSTMLVDTLAAFSHRPENFLNAHFLNPAYLIPLVEVSPSDKTDTSKLKAFTELLESIGKTPVQCKASPGYIVPRFQSLIMAEAVRMIEEGIATAEDIDRAVTTGFGVRYATMGPVEFIDWGGVDILHYANKYLSKELGERFRAPAMVDQKIADGHLGMNHGKGFYDFNNMDVEAYKREKLSTFIALLKHLDLMPKAR